jgi:hypothetical protein
MKLADRLSALPTTSFRSCAFDCDHQVAALVDLGLQDANIRYFQWNDYLGFAHGWFYSVFPAILHPQIWGLPRQFPMSHNIMFFPLYIDYQLMRPLHYHACEEVQSCLYFLDLALPSLQLSFSTSF